MGHCSDKELFTWVGGKIERWWDIVDMVAMGHCGYYGYGTLWTLQLWDIGHIVANGHCGHCSYETLGTL